MDRPERKPMTLSLRQDLIEWLNKTFPKRVGEAIEPLLEELKRKHENIDKGLSVQSGIPIGVRRENGYVEFAPGRWCEEKVYYRIGSVLKEIAGKARKEST